MLIERCPRPIGALLPLQRRQIPIEAFRDSIRRDTQLVRRVAVVGNEFGC